MTRRALWSGLIVFGLVLAVWALLAPGASTWAQAALPTPSPEQRLVALTNRERAKAGLPPLRENPLLAQAALTHARAMAEGDFFAHENLVTGTGPADRVLTAGYRWMTVAENIFAGAEAPETALAEWLNSPGHRANILNPQVREIGVGYAFDPTDVYPDTQSPYRHYWVQVLAADDRTYPVIINGEAFSTTTPVVSLYSYGEGWAETMRLRNDEEPFGPWEPYRPLKEWRLAEQPGWRTVTVELRRGNEVRSATDGIYYLPGGGMAVLGFQGQVEPTPTLAPGLPPRLTEPVSIERRLDPPDLTAGRETRVTLRLRGTESEACQGIPGRPADVFLMFDVSSSAGLGPGSNWEGTLAFTRALLDSLSQPIALDLQTVQTSQVGLITSRTVATGTVPLLQQPLTADYEALKADLGNIAVGGDTDIAAGVQLAAAELMKAPALGRERVIVLMLHDNVPLTEAAITAIGDVRNQGIAVYMVANSQNIAPENQITAELAARAVAPQDFFPDPEPTDLRRLFIRVTAGDPEAAVRAFRLVETWSPAAAVELTDVTGPGGRVERNQALWDIPRLGRGETIEIGYTVRVHSGAADPSLQVGLGAAGIDCNGYLFSTFLEGGIGVAPGPTATPLVMALNTPAPTPTPTPTVTPTPLGALVTPALPPTPTPSPLQQVPRPTQPVFCTARYWWVPAILFPLLLVLLVFLLLWLWSRRQHIAWYNLWWEWRWPCRILSLLTFLYLLWLAFLVGRELFVGLCRPSEAVYFWRMDRSRGDFGIFLTTMGSETEPIPFQALNREGCVGCHAVAPAGGRIAAVEGPVPGRGLVRTLAGQVVSIPDIPAMYFAWSPDGSKLAYASADGDIYVLDIQSGANTPLPGASMPDVAETMPAWSADGSSIAFVRSETPLEWGLNVQGPSDIYLVPAAGGEARPLPGASGGGFNYYPAFSPDGKWLAFTRHTTGQSSYADDAAEIYIVPATGGEARRLQANDAADGTPLQNVSNSWPTWSRDGRLLAFNSKRNDPAFDIFVTEIDAAGNSGPAQPLAGAAQPGVFEHTPFWGEPIQPLPLSQRLLNLWPWLIPLLLLLILRTLLCRGPKPQPKPVLPGLGERPEPRQPFDFLSRWRPLPPEWDPAPTLVIGLGGTGRWVLTHLKKNLEDAGADTWRRRVRLLLVDTAASEFVDGREVPARVGDVELDEDEKLILGEDLGEFVRRLAQAPDLAPEMEAWFPAGEYIHIRRLPAAQLDVRRNTSLRRPLGRAVVFRNIQQGERSSLWQTLDRAVRETVEGEQARVVVVSSLCGGFGSGALADVAYLVRRAAEGTGGDRAASAVITAFLVTENAFTPYTRASQLKLNTMATLREVGRFLLATGRPFPMVYDRESRSEIFNGYVRSALFDDVFLFDGSRDQYPLTLYPPDEGMFPLMADLIQASLDRGSQFVEQVRANLRTRAAHEQVTQGEPVLSTLGGFTYRLPLRDLVRGLKLRFAHDLIALFLVGPDVPGIPNELRSDLCRDKYPDGIPTLVDHFLRGTMAEQRQGVGGPSVFIADLAAGGGISPAWASLTATGDEQQQARQRDEHIRHFQAVLTATVLRLLNGRPEDDVITARTGKIGYTLAFLDELLAALQRAGDRAGYLQQQATGETASALSSLRALIEREQQITRGLREQLQRRVGFLLGEQPAGRPGVKPVLRGLLDLLQERLEQERKWREQMRRIKVRHTFAEEAFFDDLYRNYFQPHLESEGLERLFWRSDDGNLEIVIRHWEDVTFTTDAAGQERFIGAMLDLAEVVGQEVWKLRLDPLFDNLDTGLWNERQVRNQAQNAHIWAEPVAKVRAVRGREQQPHRYLWANRAIARREAFAREVQLAANMAEAVQILDATDPYSAAVLTSLDILPVSALECVVRLEDDYRRAHRLSTETTWDDIGNERPQPRPEQRPEPVHVFAAERHALLYEPRLPELKEAPRLFHPLFVAALEDLARARAFVLAYALGWVRRERYQQQGLWRVRYELWLPDRNEGIPLTRPDDTGDPVALIVRAMQGVVLGFPEADRLQYRYTTQELAAMLIRAVNEHVPAAVERLRTFLRRQPDDLAEDRRLGADDFWSFAQLVVEDELRSLLERQRR